MIPICRDADVQECIHDLVLEMIFLIATYLLVLNSRRPCSLGLKQLLFFQTDNLHWPWVSLQQCFHLKLEMSLLAWGDCRLRQEERFKLTAYLQPPMYKKKYVSLCLRRQPCRNETQGKNKSSAEGYSYKSIFKKSKLKLLGISIQSKGYLHGWRLASSCKGWVTEPAVQISLWEWPSTA